MHASNNAGPANTRKYRPDMLRAPVSGAVLFILVALEVHGSGWLGLKTIQNDPCADEGVLGGGPTYISS